jgi:transposase
LVEIAGRKVKVFLFVATLGYSRRLHVRAFRHERQESWFDGIESSFLALGGVPEEVLFDNPRALVTEHDAETRTVVLMRSFWPSPGIGAFGPVPARRIGHAPRARRSPTPCKQACMGTPRRASAM